MEDQKILGVSCGGFDFGVYKNAYAKTKKFSLKVSDRVIANFDTEEKARIYADGMQKGLDYGYSLGYEKFKNKG